MQGSPGFLHKEDLWSMPQEIYADKQQAMEPYYSIMRLPVGRVRSSSSAATDAQQQAEHGRLAGGEERW